MKFTSIGGFWTGKTSKGTSCLNGSFNVHPKEERSIADILGEMAKVILEGGKVNLSVYPVVEKKSDKAPDYRLVWRQAEESDRKPTAPGFESEKPF